VADRKTLKEFFGQHLRENSLPALHELEARSKEDVQSKLSQATSECGKDRAYAKGKRSFELLGKLNPDELKKHLPHFKQLCEMLETKLGSS